MKQAIRDVLWLSVLAFVLLFIVTAGFNHAYASGDDHHPKPVFHGHKSNAIVIPVGLVALAIGYIIGSETGDEPPPAPEKNAKGDPLTVAPPVDNKPLYFAVDPSK